MKKTVIFDLDGTLANGDHRLHLLPSREMAHTTSSWDAFNLAAKDDAPISNNIELCRTMHAAGYRIVILTGRCDVAKRITKDWLDYRVVPYDKLIMRKAGDNRTDIEFKREAVGKLKNILCAFDDLEHIAKAMRSWGITCHLVTHYEHDLVHVSKNVK
jgi:phosphoglycolate phosphatase-like HAD superfamily hydrolase